LDIHFFKIVRCQTRLQEIRERHRYILANGLGDFHYGTFYIKLWLEAETLSLDGLDVLGVIGIVLSFFT